MEGALQLVVVAILVEAVWENIKMLFPNKKFSISMLGSLLVSILVCVLASVDIFPIVGVTISVPVIGSVLTGIIVSRGANFVSDLFTKLEGGTTDGK